jgi:hypothetical protein
MAHLLLCRHCTRYFKHVEPACPFCTTTPLSREAPRPLALPSSASRSRIHAARMALLASAATFVACTDPGSASSDSGSPGTATDLGSMAGGSDAAAGRTTTMPDDGGPQSSAIDDSPNGNTDSNGDDDLSDDDLSADETVSDDDDLSADEAVSDDDDLSADDVSSVESTPDSGLEDGTTADETDASDPVTQLGGAACPGHEEPGPGVVSVCRSDADCGSGTVCSPVPVQIYPDRDPCTFQDNYCDPASCDGECQPDGSGCPTSSVCVQTCSETNCSGVSHCVNNQCVPKPCNAEGAQECATGFECVVGDTDAPAQCLAIVCDQAGTAGCIEGRRCAPNDTEADAFGCVPITCAEDGGPSCQDFFACSPQSPDADYQGCVRLSCMEAGSQPCQEFYGCNPESPQANYLGCAPLSCEQPGAAGCPEGMACRPEAQNAIDTGTLVGCATIRCDEPSGPECGADWSCTPGALNAQANGCAPTSCLAGWSCDPWRDCDAEAAAADPHGCLDRACTVDTDCGCGFCFNEVCVPDTPICRVPEIVATPYGCVWPDDEFV